MARRRRPTRTATSRRRDSSVSSEPPMTDPGAAPVAGAETTGRFLVVYKDPVLQTLKDAERALRDHAGMKSIVSAADFSSHAVDAKQADKADAATSRARHRGGLGR